MNKTILHQLGLLGLVSVALFGATGCQKEEKLADVNGEAITMKEFYDYLKVKPEVQIVADNGSVVAAPVAETLAFQGLQDMIRQRVIMQLAKDMKVEPSKDQINKEVEFQRKRDENFISQLMEKGLTLDQIRSSLKVDLAREMLLTKGITITDAEVDAQIKNNPQMFTIPTTVDALWVFVKEERTKRDVDRALDQGTTFSTVATRYSDAPGAKESQGRFPQRVPGMIPSADIRDLLLNTPEGKTTEWVKLSDGWARFFIEDRQQEIKKEPRDVDRQWIKRQLAVQKGLTANDLDKRLLDKLKNAKISIYEKELEKPWKAAMESLDKAAEEDKNKGTGTMTGEGSPTNGEKPAGSN